MTTRRQFLKLLGIAPAAAAVKPLADMLDKIAPAETSKITISNPVKPSAGGTMIPSVWSIDFDHMPLTSGSLSLGRITPWQTDIEFTNLPTVPATRGRIQYPEIS